MGFIQDEDIIGFVEHKFPDGHSIRHEGQFGLGWSFFLEPNTIAHFIPYVEVHFMGDSFRQGDRTDSSGLWDHDGWVVMEQILWDLGGFSASSFPTEDGDIMGGDGL